MLEEYEEKFSNHKEIYYYRELIGESVERRRIDLVTISSHDKIMKKREESIEGLFPDKRKRC
jgi:hypothetical protein